MGLKGGSILISRHGSIQVSVEGRSSQTAITLPHPYAIDISFPFNQIMKTGDTGAASGAELCLAGDSE